MVERERKASGLSAYCLYFSPDDQDRGLFSPTVLEITVASGRTLLLSISHYCSLASNWDAVEIIIYDVPH